MKTTLSIITLLLLIGCTENTVSSTHVNIDALNVLNDSLDSYIDTLLSNRHVYQQNNPLNDKIQ